MFLRFRLKSLWVWMRVVTFAPPGGLVEPFSAVRPAVPARAPRAAVPAEQPLGLTLEIL
jgi:hypothetical protein